jgi:hypothetical protein
MFMQSLLFNKIKNKKIPFLIFIEKNTTKTLSYQDLIKPIKITKLINLKKSIQLLENNLFKDLTSSNKNYNFLSNILKIFSSKVEALRVFCSKLLPKKLSIFFALFNENPKKNINTDQTLLDILIEWFKSVKERFRKFLAQFKNINDLIEYLIKYGLLYLLRLFLIIYGELKNIILQILKDIIFVSNWLVSTELKTFITANVLGSILLYFLMKFFDKYFFPRNEWANIRIKKYPYYLSDAEEALIRELLRVQREYGLMSEDVDFSNPKATFKKYAIMVAEKHRELERRLAHAKELRNNNNNNNNHNNNNHNNNNHNNNNNSNNKIKNKINKIKNNRNNKNNK